MNVKDFSRHMEGFFVYLKTEKNLSVHTSRAYEGDLRQFVEFWIDLEEREKNVKTIAIVIERHFVALKHKKIDASSIARKVSCLRSYEKFIERQLCTKLNLPLVRPRVDKKLPLSFPVDKLLLELDALDLEKLPTHYPLRDRAIFELLYATGVRCSELVALKIRDIQFSDRTIFIQGKGARERVICFGTTCEKRLLTYLAHERAPLKHSAEHLFLNYREEPLTTRSVQRICAMFRAFLDIERPLTPHKLRNSFAVHLVHQGTDPKIMQELLGYKTMASTEKYGRTPQEPPVKKTSSDYIKNSHNSHQ